MNDWFEAEQHVERAHEFFEANRLSEAESELREAIALYPFRAEWHFNLGLTLDASGRRREAVAAFLEAHRLEPGETQASLLIGLNLLRADDSDNADAAEAVRWLEEAAAIKETKDDAVVHLIEAHARLGEHDEAEVAFYLCLQLPDADHALAYVNIADSLTDRGEHERAAAALREAVQLDPAMTGVYARLANVYAALGRRDRARRLYLRELRQNPGDIDTLLDLGVLLVQMNRPAEAAEKFRRVLEIESDNADAHYELGVLALTEGRLDDARRSLRLVLRLDPADLRARRRLAEVHERSGRRREAQAILVEQARTLDEFPAETTLDDRAELGLMLLDVDRPLEAAAVLEAVVADRSDDPAIWRALSVALLRSGRRADGVRAARRERRLAPDSVPAMHNIAMALLMEGRLDRAAVWIRRALRAAPEDAGLRRLRRRLRWARAARALKP